MDEVVVGEFGSTREKQFSQFTALKVKRAILGNSSVKRAQTPRIKLKTCLPVTPRR